MMSNSEFGSISFDLPKNQSNVIKVIGVGGGGIGAISPGLAVGAAAIPSIYSPVGIAAMTKMIAGQRPEIMRSLGRATQDRALQATPVMLQGLIND